MCAGFSTRFFSGCKKSSMRGMSVRESRVICFIGAWNKLGKNLEYEETTAEIIPKPVKIFRNKIKIPISGFLLHSLNKDAILDLEEKESNYHWLKAVEGDSHGKKRRISKSVTHMAG